jgi:hypothetical protein
MLRTPSSHGTARYPPMAPTPGKIERRRALRSFRQPDASQLDERASWYHKDTQFEDGSIAQGTDIMDILDRMQTGLWRIFRHLNDWFDALQLYHREDGKIVKKNG